LNDDNRGERMIVRGLYDCVLSSECKFFDCVPAFTSLTNLLLSSDVLCDYNVDLFLSFVLNLELRSSHDVLP